jgi:hypothetical protein
LLWVTKNIRARKILKIVLKYTKTIKKINFEEIDVALIM